MFEVGRKADFLTRLTGRDWAGYFSTQSAELKIFHGMKYSRFYFVFVKRT